MVKAIRAAACAWLLSGATALAAGGAADEPLVKERRWKEAQDAYALKLLDFAEAKGPKADKELARLALVYNLGRFFGQMDGEDATALTEWLLGETKFTAALLDAFAPEDSPVRAFRVLGQLRKRFGERKLLNCAGLAIAFAVVWDGEEPVSKKFDACDSFAYYVSPGSPMAFDVQNLPYEPALFLACAEAAPEERAWASQKYKRPRTMSAVYHGPPYDMEFLFGKPKKIDRQEYTLENLLKYGGVCGDRAYFCANVARSWGIPAARISGVGERGGHAWTGYIRPGTQGRYVWELGCGRYEYDRYYTGSTRDPQTRKRINDYELSMRTLGCSLSEDKVRIAGGYELLAGLLEQRKQFPLVRWAVEQALRNNRFNLSAWERATRLCKEGVFDAAYADRLMDLALEKFPDELDFCYGVFTAMMATVPKEQAQRQKRLFLQARNFFKARPDLTSSIGAAYGDYLLETGKKREAYDVYHDTIRAHMSDPRLVTDIAIKVSQKRLEGDEPKKAVTLLAALLRYAVKPPYGDAFAKHSAWYRLQTCLKGVYEETGDSKAAATIEAELAKYKRR